MPQVLHYYRKDPDSLDSALGHRMIGFGSGTFVGFMAVTITTAVVVPTLQYDGKFIFMALLWSVVSSKSLESAVRRRARHLGPVVGLKSWSWASLAGVVHGSLLIPVLSLIRFRLPNWLLAPFILIAMVVTIVVVMAASWSLVLVRPSPAVTGS